MRRLIPILPLLLIGCSPEIEFVPMRPEFDPDTLTPCAIPPGGVRTVNELAALAIENLRAAECANSKILAIGEVLTAFDADPALTESPSNAE